MAERHESDARDQHSLLPDESQPPVLDTEGSHIQRWGPIHIWSSLSYSALCIRAIELI